MSDTFYWVFSTLPQVIAALTGLLVAGTTFFFSSLETQAVKDESLLEILDKVKSLIHSKSIVLLLLSIIAIVFDVLILLFTPDICYLFEFWRILTNETRVAVVAGTILIIFVNGIVFVRLCNLLSSILNPDYRKKVIERMSKDVTKQKKAVNEDYNVVNAMEFFNQFRVFEHEARDIAEKYSPDYKFQGMSSLVNLLIQVKAISRNERSDVLELIRIRNLIAHNNDLSSVPEVYYKRLLDLTSRLTEFYKKRKT